MSYPRSSVSAAWEPNPITEPRLWRRPLRSIARVIAARSRTVYMVVCMDSLTIFGLFAVAAMKRRKTRCAQKGREFVPTNMGQTRDGGIPGYTVTFQCLLASDPRVASYHLGQSPNIIVEQRNR